jgi:hypothetical protein
VPRTVVKILIGLACFLAAAFVLAFGSGYAVGYFYSDDAEAMAWLTNVGAPIVLGLIGLVLMVGALWLGAIWMRSIDEAAREAHKSAWFWGGSAGMATGGLAIILSFLPQAANWPFPFTFFDRQDPAAYAAGGAYAMMVLMLIGYCVAWAWWWWKRR